MKEGFKEAQELQSKIAAEQQTSQAAHLPALDGGYHPLTK